MVVTVGSVRNTQVNLGEYLVGGVDKAEQEGHPIGGGIGGGGGI